MELNVYANSIAMEKAQFKFNGKAILEKLRHVVRVLVDFFWKQIQKINKTRKMLMQSINLKVLSIRANSRPCKMILKSFLRDIKSTPAEENFMNVAMESVYATWYEKKIKATKILKKTSEMEEKSNQLIMKILHFEDSILEAYELNMKRAQIIAKKVMSGGNLTEKELRYIEKLKSNSCLDTVGSSFDEIASMVGITGDDIDRAADTVANAIVSGEKMELSISKCKDISVNLVKNVGKNFFLLCKAYNDIGYGLQESGNQIVRNLGSLIEEFFQFVQEIISEASDISGIDDVTVINTGVNALAEEIEGFDAKKVAINVSKMMGSKILDPMTYVKKALHSLTKPAEAVILISDITIFTKKLGEVANQSYDLSLKLQKCIDKLYDMADESRSKDSVTESNYDFMDRVDQLHAVLDMINAQAAISPKKLFGSIHFSLKNILKMPQTNEIKNTFEKLSFVD